MNEFTVRLDLAKGKARQQQTVFVRQGDKNATTIVATITDHGVAASTSGMTARFSMRLPNGTEYYRKTATLSGNTVTVTIDETQAASVAGRTDVAYFQLLQGSTVVASTESFTVIVLPDALADATVPKSYDSAIQEAIDALDAAVEQLPSTVEDVLADHPEWTTTVQDGSITEPKLATDLARDRERLLYRLDNLLTATLPEGETATATDAAKTPMAGLALYGRSTQDGTPTPDAPVPIESVAGNLLPPGTDTTVNGIAYTVDDDGVVTLNGTCTATSYFTIVTNFTLPAGTYRLSANNATTTDMPHLYCKYGSTYHRESQGPLTIDEQTTFDFFALRVPSGTYSDYKCYPQVMRGITAYPYVPYGHAGLWARRTSDASEQTVTPIDLDGHELRSLPDGTRDELTVDARGHAVLVQRVGSVDLGTLTWAPISSSDTSKKRMASSSVRSSISPTPSGAVPNVMCERYQPKKNSDVYKLGTGVNIASDGDIVVYDPDYNTNDSASAFAAAVSGVALIYPLATPVTHDLGTIDPVPLVGPDLTAQAVPTAPFALTYERDLNATLARLESAIAAIV